MPEYIVATKAMLKEVVKEAIREELLEIFLEALPYVSKEEEKELEEIFGNTPSKEDLEPAKEGLEWIGK